MTNLIKRAALRLMYGLIVVAAMLIMSAALATAQETTTAQAAQGAEAKSASATPADAPVFKDYRGVSVGMSADAVRQKLGQPEEKFDDMDIFVFSDKERARVFYDKDKKARAVSVTYVGASAAPKPADVLGTEIESKQDGSMHKMVTYPEAGYWVSYSRTAGESPLVMITMQKTP
ncbi:MAG TPA: hypothetical protein VD861_13535 [Pyrinomonadaceae bacterium]|nr:hypothetical protein [Pyrinomonadaceae bacterium]